MVTTELQRLASVALPLSLFLIVFSLGLRTSLMSAIYLLRAPRRLARSIVAMYVVMPICVVLLISAFALHPAVKVGLVALAVSPVPPLLPRRERKVVAAGHDEYVYGLLVATCLLAIVVAPAAIPLIAALFGLDVDVAPWSIARVVFFSVLLPLGIGLALRRWWPASQRLAGAAEVIGMALLFVAVALVLVRVWPAMDSLVGDGTVLTIVAVALVALASGHWLGGPVDDDRTVLALSNSLRHPGVAIAVASAADQSLAPAAISLAFVVSLVTTVPYAAWRKRLRRNGRAAEGKSSVP